jgi:hypothetical protein
MLLSQLCYGDYHNWRIKMYQMDVNGFLKDKVHTCLSKITGTHKNLITWCIPSCFEFLQDSFHENAIV